MQNINNPESLEGYHKEIDIREVLEVLWLGKVKILAITLIFAISSVFYALSIPNQYKATALLAPAQYESAGISSSLGQLGGLASLAGVNFGNTGSSETEMAKAIMISWNFIEDFINKNDLALSFMLLRVGIKS